MKREPKRGIKLQLCRQLLRFYFRRVFVFVRLVLVFCFWSLMARSRVALNGMEWRLRHSLGYKVTQVPRPRPLSFHQRFLLTAPSLFFSFLFQSPGAAVSCASANHFRNIFTYFASVSSFSPPPSTEEPARLQSPTWPTLACRAPHLLHNFWFAATAAVVTLCVRL